jgi:spermidine synthase
VTDGKTQSTQFDEYIYHESLVHPAMLKFASTGKCAETVFIGGGGELATAREVLRHKSVKRVVMVDIDEKVVSLCKQFLPEWGGEQVASDPRLEIVIGDAHKYLLETKETFDVIIMDISDPIEAGPGIMLYTKEFYEHTLTCLNLPRGVFVSQSGMAESQKIDAADTSCFAPITNTLRTSFDCVLPYVTNIPSFGSDWGFTMAFQAPDKVNSVNYEKDWMLPSIDSIDNLIEDNVIGGANELRHYDGITHLSMFALTKPLRVYFQKDDRIMTKDNPIFMF